MTNIQDMEKRFDEEKLHLPEWCGNEDHDCACSPKIDQIKEFYRKEFISLLEGLKPKLGEFENPKHKNGDYEIGANNGEIVANSKIHIKIDRLIKDL